MCIRDRDSRQNVERILRGENRPEGTMKDDAKRELRHTFIAVSYTHLRAHETVLDLVCRLLLEKKQIQQVIRLLSLNIIILTTHLRSISFVEQLIM